MNTKSPRKLSLSRSTLRQLTVTDLGEVAGGTLNSRDANSTCITPGCTQGPVSGCKPKVMLG